MRRARRIARGGVLVAAALALTACTATAMPTPTPTPDRTVTPSGDGVLRIGTLFPTTGAQAAIGAGQVAAVNVAIREINAAGGYGGAPVEVVNRSSGDAASGAAATSFAELVARGVDVVIGPDDGADAAAVLPLAIEAGIPLITPGASDPLPDDEGFLFRTIPGYAHQGAVLGRLIADDGAESVVLVAADDETSSALAASLEAALDAEGAELLETITVGPSARASSVAADVRAADADAVVVATRGGELTAAVLTELADTGVGGDELWLATGDVGDYSATVPAGTLDGARGIHDGAAVDEAFAARMRIEDPQLAHTRFAAESYDAVVLAALAAVIADDDGGASIAWRLPEAGGDGIPCTSFGACLDVLETEPAIAYAGLAGPLGLDGTGDPSHARYALVRFAADGTFAADGVVEG